MHATLRAEAQPQLTTKRYLLMTFIGFIVTWGLSGVLAFAIIEPAFYDDYRQLVGEGRFLPPFIIPANLVMAAIMVFLYLRVELNGTWLRRSLALGTMVGILYSVVPYAILAGYADIDATAIILSGVVYALSPIVGMMAIGATNNRLPT